MQHESQDVSIRADALVSILYSSLLLALLPAMSQLLHHPLVYRPLDGVNNECSYAANSKAPEENPHPAFLVCELGDAYRTETFLRWGQLCLA